ncbi:MAG TPA: DegT/DnrJ/EryC1/StrS family aminotransferase [Solirubrobacterales bacterium]|nr:DegT/DnrJ/EryC1/StrS family aminotransferase [Solirubrobacterales bacterium]
MSDGAEQIPLSGPELGSREEELVLEVLRSGRLSLGPMGERFERVFADFLGVEDAVAVSSGTAALHLGVRQLGWGPGDEVVTSPFTFVASANCLLYEGARPVFVDVDPVTLDIDPDAAAAAVTERTAGLLPIDIFGWPAAWPELEALAAKRGLGVLEDSCEALGAVDSEGRMVGTRGNFSTFAFYANKQMTTGEGGMIVPTDPDAAARLRSERNQGRAVDMGWLDHDRLGFNYRLSDVQAAIGVAQVEKLPALLERRAAVAASYRERLAGVPGVEAPFAARGREVRSWFVYVVRLADEVDRDAVIRVLRERGIDSKSYLPSIHLFPHLAALGYREGQFPVAEAASAHSLALPFFPALDEERIERVCAALAAAVDATRRG